MDVNEKAMIEEDLDADRIRFIQNALEYVLTLGDFQKEVNGECTPEDVAQETVKRIARIMQFDSCGIYLVDEQTSDLQISVCLPDNARASLEDEMSFLIDNGFVAWAIRERRWITLNSKDGSRKILLHVMATYSRIRGLFVGIFPSQTSKYPDTSFEILSIILRNASNGIESLIYSSMIRKQKLGLEKEVEQKTRQLVHYEKQLLQAQNMETVAALASGVAHQFNNALQVLMGSIDLTSMIAEESPEILKHLARTRPIIEQMSNLTSQLTSYAREGTYIANQVVSVKSLLIDSLPSINNSIKETVKLSVDLADESVTVDVDLIQLQTVMIAIITNANEAIVDSGSIRISSRLLFWNVIPENIKGELVPGDYVCLSFEDDGSGMDGNTLRRLFEPFYSTKFLGRGLSMAAASGIINRHNGWIHVESEMGKGTIVHVYLPKSP